MTEHIDLETLARLVDEAPDASERAHLEACEACRAELEALRRQKDELASLPALEPAADAWPALEARLRDEGLIRNRAKGGASTWLRAAAAAAIFLLGGATGFAVRDAGHGAGYPALRGARLASLDTPTLEEAERAVQEAQELYLAALADYAELTNAPAVGDPAARLAALDNIVLTTQTALNEAPADPVLNGYLFTALAQRDVMTRELARDEGDPWF